MIKANCQVSNIHLLIIYQIRVRKKELLNYDQHYRHLNFLADEVVQQKGFRLKLVIAFDL